MQAHEPTEHDDRPQPAPEGLGTFEQLQGRITLVALVMHKRRKAIAQLQARNLEDQALQDTLCDQLLTRCGAVVTMDDEGTVSLTIPGADGNGGLTAVFTNENRGHGMKPA